MEKTIARKADAKNEKKRKRDEAQALSEANSVELPILVGPSFVSPPVSKVSISTTSSTVSTLSTLPSASSRSTSTALFGDCNSQRSITVDLEEFQVSKKDPTGFRRRSTAQVVKLAHVKMKNERLIDRAYGCNNIVH